ncbi:hypothetical protein Ancab_015272 [Ancistrocladus abbreviatus]
MGIIAAVEGFNRCCSSTGGQVCQVQSYVDTLDVLKTRRSNPVGDCNNTATVRSFDWLVACGGLGKLFLSGWCSNPLLGLKDVDEVGPSNCSEPAGDGKGVDFCHGNLIFLAERS